MCYTIPFALYTFLQADSTALLFTQKQRGSRPAVFNTEYSTVSLSP